MGESRPVDSAELAKSADWRIYRRLLAYVVPMWPYFVVALVGFGFGNAAEAYFARLFGDIVEALAHPGPDDWIRFPLLMLATVLVRGLGDFSGEFFLSRVSYRVVHRLRMQLFDQLLRMPSTYFDRSAKGHLVSRITFNVAQLRDTATDALKSVVQDGSKVLVLLGAMIWANWRLTLIFLVIAPVVALVVSYASNRFRQYQPAEFKTRWATSPMLHPKRSTVIASFGHSAAKNTSANGSKNRAARISSKI